MAGCDRCDTVAGVKTYENQVAMPIRGRVRYIDHCIHDIVAALNAANLPTTASCCGHGRLPGVIALEDGRAIGVFDSYETAEEAMRYGRRGSRTSSRSRGDTSSPWRRLPLPNNYCEVPVGRGCRLTSAQAGGNPIHALRDLRRGMAFSFRVQG